MEKAEGRYEDFRWLRTEIGLSIKSAGKRVGVGFRQAQRYERRMKAEEL